MGEKAGAAVSESPSMQTPLRTALTGRVSAGSAALAHYYLYRTLRRASQSVLRKRPREKRAARSADPLHGVRSRSGIGAGDEPPAHRKSCRKFQLEFLRTGSENSAVIPCEKPAVPNSFSLPVGPILRTLPRQVSSLIVTYLPPAAAHSGEKGVTPER